MIDKDLYELKKDLPEYNIDDYKSDIYVKYNYKKSIKTSHFPKLVFILILLIMSISIIGLSTYAIKVEAKEYRNAVEFFEANELLLDGLTRYEIKEIYKDITTNKFKYKKTGEVIVESIKSKVPGYSIEIDNLDSDKIINAWELYEKIRKEKINELINEIKKEEYIYKYKSNNDDGTYTYIFEKYNEGVLEWNIDINHSIKGYREYEDSLLIYGGYNYNSLREYSPKFYITKLNKNGIILWQKEFNNSYSLSNVFHNDEGYTMFLSQYSNRKNFIIMKLDDLGNVLYENVYCNEFDINNIKVVNMNNYYLAYLKNYSNNHCFITINNDGTVENSFNYIDENYVYYFTDMIEFNDKLYLSGFMVPVYNTSYSSNRQDMHKILDILHKMDYEKITSDYVLDLFKENYTSVLFVCNNNDGDLNLFYKVDFSQGAKLSIENDKLIWEVESFNSMIYSPFTSSFTFGGTLKVYEYIYDEEGRLLDVYLTDELREYRR